MGGTTRKKKKKEKPESIQVLVSVGIAMILLYAIVSYSTSKSTAVTLTNEPLTPTSVKVESATDPATLTDEDELAQSDSPYSGIFGKEKYDETSKNSITLNLTSGTEAVVCLVNTDSKETIRNQYLHPATTFKFNHIPDGNYFLKIYYGHEWSADKSFPFLKAKGRFNQDVSFVLQNTGAHQFKMQQSKDGNSIHFSSYEITLNADDKEGIQKITAENFFK